MTAFASKAAIDTAVLLGRFADALATEVKGWPVIGPQFDHLHLEGSRQSQCITYSAQAKPEAGGGRVMVLATAFGNAPLRPIATFNLN